METDLERTWERMLDKLADTPSFLASRWPRSQWPALWQRLGLSAQAGRALLTCWAPRPDRRETDIATIAEHVGADPLQLDVELRIAEVRASHFARSVAAPRPDVASPPGR